MAVNLPKSVGTIRPPRRLTPAHNAEAAKLSRPNAPAYSASSSSPMGASASSDNSGLITGAVVGGIVDGLEGAIIGGVIGSLFD